MGHFNVRGRLTGPTGLSEDVDLFVDTGSTFLVVPQALASRLELVVRQTVRLRIAGDEVVNWPLADVWLRLENQQAPTGCLIAPEGPAILGMVALETLLLAVDPVRQRLVPIDAYLLAAR